MYKSDVRPAMLYGMETAAVTERQMGKMEVAELKMVRWALGVKRKVKIRNEYVRNRNAKLQTREKERRRLRGKEDNGNGDARYKEKRKAMEKVDGFGNLEKI